jgi:tricorn protease
MAIRAMRETAVKTRILYLCLLTCAPLGLAPGWAAASPDGPVGYYRFPALHGDTLVFCAEGDLWMVSSRGGLARRLTTHLAEESHPAISPDGQLLAFTAAYEGPREVYVMPLAGGLPRRLTYEGETAIVVGWDPRGRILYRTRKPSTLPNAMLVAVDPGTGLRETLPLAQAAEGSYDPASGTLFFTRLAAQGSHTKRYKGGTAQRIWRFAPGDSEAVLLTGDYDGTSRHPMWWNGRVYFVTDRDGTMNIWSMNPDGGDLRQHTHHQGWDVKDPSLWEGRIAYRLGADLRLLDLRSGEDRLLEIRLPSDFDQQRERWITEPMEYLTAAHVSPDGDRLVLTARGQVFVAPVTQGRFVEATRARGVRYRRARFFPDGKTLAVLSDASGEVEWWRLPADGVGEPEQLTHDGHVLRLDGAVSPDGRWIASYNHDQEMWLYDLEEGTARKIAFSPLWGFDGPVWSPDSRWLAYAMPAESSFQQIHLYDTRTGKTWSATSERFDSWSPAWSPDGQWLYFLSKRRFHSVVRSPWGSRQPEPFFDKQTKIYALALRPGLRFPFRPKDELSSPEEGTDSGETKVVPDGIGQRLHEVPVPPGNYEKLSVASGRLFWLSRKTLEGEEKDLMVRKITHEDTSEVVFVADVKDYEVSANGQKILVRKGETFYVLDADAKAPANLSKAKKVDLSQWRFPMDPREEWRQMFVESWRLERDYFYDPGMHGLDWKAVLEKYLPLVDRVTTRGELSDLQAQMASELSALHTFVYGGDHRKGPEEIYPASLGARWVRDPEAGGYRILHIYRAAPDRPELRSPLAEPWVNVKEGDVLLAINGVPLMEVDDPGYLLRDQAGRQVRIRIRSAEGGETRDLVVVPLTPREEADLRYAEWEWQRALMVDSLSSGRIGYVHLRAMGRRDIGQWVRDFYPVFNRQGLIVDVRHNRGGNIDSWVLEKLLRRAWMYWKPRVGDVYWNMQYAFRGHMVVLVDEWTASDGEAFAEGFRRLGLGKVIGRRTWGGEIWLTSSNVLVDRGIVTAAEFGVYGPEGDWLIEGHGVEPDIEVDNLPHETFLGRDRQLETAVEYLLKRIQEEPNPVPPPPPYPRIEEE